LFCDLGYLGRVGASAQSASARERLFADLANRPWSGDRVAKLHALQRLERESIALLESILDAANGTGIPPRLPASGVRTRARVIAGRRWIEIVETFTLRLPKQVGQIEQLERLAPVCDSQPLARVTAHHIALQMFMRLELAGRGRESIQPALALIPADPLPLAAAAG
jgi:hypothetical protein